MSFSRFITNLEPCLQPSSNHFHSSHISSTSTPIPQSVIHHPITMSDSGGNTDISDLQTMFAEVQLSSMETQRPELLLQAMQVSYYFLSTTTVQIQICTSNIPVLSWLHSHNAVFTNVVSWVTSPPWLTPPRHLRADRPDTFVMSMG